RDKTGIPARVAGIEYDPNRSAHLALLHYRDGEKRYIIAPHGLKVGDVLMSGPQADIVTGNAPPIRNIPVATTVHNVELRPGGGAEGKGTANPPMTPWGKPTKGYKARRGARPSDAYTVTRRKK